MKIYMKVAGWLAFTLLGIQLLRPAAALASSCDELGDSSLNLSFEQLSIGPSGADGKFSDIVVGDKSAPCSQTALKRGVTGAKLGRPRIDFEGGSESERFAKVVPEPGNPTNHVLQFSLQSPNVRTAKGAPAKGRVQMDVYNNRNLKDLEYSVRMFLPKSLNMLKDYPDDVKWLTVAEFWDTPAWSGGKFPFRVSVNLIKIGTTAGAPLMFRVTAEEMNNLVNHQGQVVWAETNDKFQVPVGKWLKLDYKWVEGDQTTGHFRMTATPDGGAPIVLFDVINYTHHPDDPSPNGLTHFCPLKLYTSRQIIEYFRSHGEALSIYWDDLRL